MSSPEPSDPEPSPEELSMPAHVYEGANAPALLRAVFQNEEARVALTALFDSGFEDLVTGGRASEYGALVERFKLKYAAVDENLAQIASRLPAALAPSVNSVLRLEGERAAFLLRVQVLRQRLSMAELDQPDRPQMAQELGALRKQMQSTMGEIAETLEELRSEAADYEE